MTQLPELAVEEAVSSTSGRVVVGVFEGEAPDLSSRPELAQPFARLAARPGWEGRDEQAAETILGDSGPVLVLRGLGRREGLGAQRLSRWLRDVVENARAQGQDEISVVLPDHEETRGAQAAARIGRALLLAAYRFERFYTDPKRSRPPVRRIVVTPPSGSNGFRAGFEVARSTAAGAELCRDLGNTPGNEATPEWMEEQCRQLAGAAGLAFEALGEDELERRGMGALLAVGAGSKHRPRLLKLGYAPGGDGSATSSSSGGLPRIAIVGKGITFDTGGISLKPSARMAEMKYDKCGACTAIGIASAVSCLELPVRLDVYLPLAENMPDGSSYRPGDIIRCYNGKTVEVLNTDAEGRLILADALSLAVESEPDALLELSTLTGACVVALGHEAAGLYTPDDDLAADLAAAAGSSGDRLWRMPLYPEYVEKLRGDHADLKNISGRWGGANTAAAFLSQFVGEMKRWAHLDIAGVAYAGEDGEEPSGATGWGVHLAVDWLRRAAED